MVVNLIHVPHTIIDFFWAGILTSGLEEREGGGGGEEE